MLSALTRCMWLRGRYEVDRRYPERVAGSYVASTLLHALLATLLFAVVSNSSQEGASESSIGGTLVTLESRAPVVAQVQVPAQQAAPVPHAPRVAPIAHPHQVVAEHQPVPPQHRELSKIVPSAPPQASPVPQASVQPNPVPTAAVFEPKVSNDLPAVPISVPTAPSIMIAAKIPPTAAPSPVPTSVPTAKATQRPPAPTAPPSARPQTPAPSAATTTAPKVVTAQAQATAAASASPAAISRASAPPAAKAGVPSPSPTQGASIAATHGESASPAPKGVGSPGPVAGNNGNAKKPGPAKLITVTPTASPASTGGASGNNKSSIDLNARLRALLPNNAVNPVQGSYHPPITLNGSMDPTPPPEIVAVTHWIYNARGGGSDAVLKMWVASVHREGPVLICEGWLVRYPQNPNATTAFGNGTQISIGAHPSRAGTLPPVVEARASIECTQRGLAPFGPSPAPSP
jgi:hypothetical protein